MSDPDSMATHLRITVDQRAGATVVRTNGEIDLATADALVQSVDGVPDGSTPIILDLSGADFIDSSGVRALLQCQASAADRGRTLMIANPSVAVTRILDLADLRSRFTEVDDPTLLT